MFEIIISFLSGIISAFTPCVIVLIPLLLYKFFQDNKKEYQHFIFFLTGYLLFYLIFGYFFKSILTSQIQNGFKFGLGTLFIVLGILAIFKKLNPINIPIIKNPFLLGMSFALIVSFNPCSIPYLSIIFSLNTNSEILINLIFFGLGSITPAFIFAIFGKKLISNITNKSNKIIEKANKFMNLILILSGIYIIYTIQKLNKNDLIIITLFLISIFYILIKVFFIINNKKDLLKIKNLLLIFSLILLIYITITNCSYELKEQNKYNNIFGINEFQIKNEISCNSNLLYCQICINCIYKFLLATSFGFISIFLFEKNFYIRKKIKDK
jgi:cytochrome c biogenesis protein CcdA